MPDGSAYAIVGGVAAFTTFATTPVVRWAAVKLGRVTPPDERRVHVKPTPSIGGVAMYVGLVAAVIVAWQMDRFSLLFHDNYELLAVIVAGGVLFGVGFVDEWSKSRPHRATASGQFEAARAEGISAPAKVAGIVVAGAALVLGGVTMWHFRIPFGSVLVLSADLRPLVTVVWLAVMVNAVNLIDGLDGLAAGIVAIASGTFFLYSWELEKGQFLFGGTNIGPFIAVVVLGICVGFLPWNVHPARIFMGDCGALLLGGLMAVCTSVVGGRVDQDAVTGTKGASGQTFFFFAPLVIPLLVLGVPLLDTAFAIVRRASRRGDITTADKDHLHHRLLRLGHGHRRSVMILWVWTALLSAAVLYPTYTGRGNSVVPLAVAAIALLLFTVLHPQVRRGRGEPNEQVASIVRAEGATGSMSSESTATGGADPDPDLDEAISS
jgi:UDP-GlcNAc:undecaprenyl-phosphate/decaprenyl-phosphate GlcNAc-1-phosphate transferase